MWRDLRRVWKQQCAVGASAGSSKRRGSAGGVLMGTEKELHCLRQSSASRAGKNSDGTAGWGALRSRVIVPLTSQWSLIWRKDVNGKILTLVSSTSLASPVANAAFPSRFQPGPAPLHHPPQRAHTSWDLPVLYADGVGVKRQQVPGGCRPPFRCSGTRGELICRLSQPSLPRNLAGKESAAGGRTERDAPKGRGRVVGGLQGRTTAPYTCPALQHPALILMHLIGCKQMMD